MARVGDDLSPNPSPWRNLNERTEVESEERKGKRNIAQEERCITY
jgi:hypothetical protein